MFNAFFADLCMAVLSNSVDMSEKKRKNRNILRLLCFILIICIPL